MRSDREQFEWFRMWLMIGLFVLIVSAIFVGLIRGDITFLDAENSGRPGTVTLTDGSTRECDYLNVHDGDVYCELGPTSTNIKEGDIAKVEYTVEHE